MNGQSYVLSSKLPAMLLPYAQQMAARTGTPIFNDSQANAMQSLDVTQNNLNQLQGIIQRNLSSGIGGRIGDIAKAKFNDIFQNSPELTEISNFRESAIKQIQALASGGSGLRINQSEIDSATNNLPLPTDNLETAMAKLTRTKQFLDNQRSGLYNLGGLRSGGNGNSNQSSSSSSQWGW